METIKEMLKSCGAFLEGHFRLTSERHSREYLEKAEIFKHPALVDDLAWEIANEVINQFKPFSKNRIEVVVGLASFGVDLANRVAGHLGEFYGEEVIAIFTEKNEEGKMIFKRGYDKEIPSRRVLIVDDVLTTGGSVGQVLREVKKLGGRIGGVGVICKRGEVRDKEVEGVPLLALLELKMEDWSAEDCPLCRQGIPITNLKK